MYPRILRILKLLETRRWLQIYKYIIYNNEYRSDPRSFEHHWTNSWNKAWKNSGPYGTWTYNLYDTGAALYQLS